MYKRPRYTKIIVVEGQEAINMLGYIRIMIVTVREIMIRKRLMVLNWKKK